MVKQKKITKKVKDKWRLKEWYKVIAPPMFNNATLGETLAEEPTKILGRTLETTAQELTGDLTKTHVKLYFQINNVRGNEAYTDFIGHDLTSDYIRRLTRRRRAKIELTHEVLTKDNRKLRVKPLAVAERKIQSSQEKAIRYALKQVLAENARAKTLSEFVRAILSGELTAKLFQRCKLIYPLRRIEIRKTEVEVPKRVEAPEAPSEVEPAPAPTPATAPSPEVEVPAPSEQEKNTESKGEE